MKCRIAPELVSSNSHVTRHVESTIGHPTLAALAVRKNKHNWCGRTSPDLVRTIFAAAGFRIKNFIRRFFRFSEISLAIDPIYQIRLVNDQCGSSPQYWHSSSQSVTNYIPLKTYDDATRPDRVSFSRLSYRIVAIHNSSLLAIPLHRRDILGCGNRTQVGGRPSTPPTWRRGRSMRGPFEWQIAAQV